MERFPGRIMAAAAPRDQVLEEYEVGAGAIALDF